MDRPPAPFQMHSAPLGGSKVAVETPAYLTANRIAATRPSGPATSSVVCIDVPGTYTVTLHPGGAVDAVDVLVVGDGASAITLNVFGDGWTGMAAHAVAAQPGARLTLIGTSAYVQSLWVRGSFATSDGGMAEWMRIEEGGTFDVTGSVQWLMDGNAPSITNRGTIYMRPGSELDLLPIDAGALGTFRVEGGRVYGG